jgi:hypothetical protein
MGNTTLHVLVIGLDPYRVPGPWDNLTRRHAPQAAIAFNHTRSLPKRRPRETMRDDCICWKGKQSL